MLVAFCLDLGNDTKVGSGTSHGKEEVGFILSGTSMDFSVGGDDGNFNNIICARTMSFGEITNSSGEQKSTSRM